MPPRESKSIERETDLREATLQPATFPPAGVGAGVDNLLQLNGDNLLQLNGDVILLRP